MSGSHAAGKGDDKLALASCHVVNKSLGNPHGAHGVDVEHLLPGHVIYVSDGLTPRPPDAGIVEQEVNGLPVESCSGRLDTREVSDIQPNDSDFVVARISQSAQL